MPGTVRYIGRKSPFRGNTLYWFAAHLRDLGIGRVVVRSKEANKFPEKCFYRITDMKPDFSHHDPNLRKGDVWGEQIFRGKNFGVVKIEGGHCSDWKLIPKEEEDKFCEINEVFEDKQIVTKLVKFPSLMGAVLQQRNNYPEPPLLKMNVPEDVEGIPYNPESDKKECT